MFGPYLIQGGLGHRVVLHTQPLLVAGELAEDGGQSPLGAWQLILQRVVMLLLQDTAWEGLLDKVLDCPQGRRRATNPNNHCVAISKSSNSDTN